MSNTHKIDASNLRKNYSLNELDETNLISNPFELFKKWFEEATKQKVDEPNAMILVTSTAKGFPSGRTVLMKNFDSTGVTFFTNYNSRKGKEIEENPNVSLVFLWKELERQVRISGKAARVSREESEAYFYSRPIESQVGALISNQSSELESKSKLLDEYEKVLKLYKETKVPFPDNWGGYKIIPIEFEFWQGQPNRLHDRIHFTKINSGWKIKRLYP